MTVYGPGAPVPPISPPPAPPGPPPGPPPGRSAARGAAAAALNATALSAGYLYLRRRPRALATLAGTVLLVLLATWLEAPGGRPVWTAVFVLWAAAMAVDGRRLGLAAPGPGPRRPWLPLGAAVALLAVVVSGYAVYQALPGRALEQAGKAHAAGDCERALDRYGQVLSARYALAFHGREEDAERGVHACEIMLLAQTHAGQEAWGEAVSAYRDYAALYEGEPPWEGVHARLSELRLAHADSLVRQGSASSIEAADNFYVQAFDEYVTLRGEQPEFPEAAEVPDRITALWDTATASLAAGDHCTAVRELRFFTRLPEESEAPEEWAAEDAARLADRARAALPAELLDCSTTAYESADWDAAERGFGDLLADFPESGQSGKVPGTLEAYRKARAQDLTGARGCEAFDELEFLADLPESNSAFEGKTYRDLAGRAENSLAEAHYQCGSAAFVDGDYDTAESHMRTVVDEHEEHDRAGHAADVLIAIEIARIGDGATNTLPDPSAAGSAPSGTTTVTIINDSGVELEILYTGPETGTASVASAGAGGGQCLAPDGKPSVTLQLAPGAYSVVARTPDGSVTPYYGSWTLLSGTSYRDCYYIEYGYGF
ncbi:hypothetical protein [Streptomyces aidingensis]|uniref:Tetratricopeptide repeat-containing protein n=1 Tax=Streptomyces aidingensis TaxID=910347 RepID=A0A1I1EHF2_9ACTN|nr:hypothetical protein [Streptomyces aidingensis]SFB86614.1 hypothetical protein SAMN05421773_101311 [Streptomyces aidingensis]